MRQLSYGLLIAFTTLAVSIGCMEVTPGGPGATDTPTTTTTMRPEFGPADETFTMGVPLLATRLKQGETRAVSISLNRGKNFDEDVTLTFGELPMGVTVEPTDPVIKHGEAEAKFTVQAAADAALGDFTIQVTGHPTDGADAKAEFKVTVTEK